MKNLILAVIFTAAPAAAQTTVRVFGSGLNVNPGLGATPMPMPTTMMMPALSPGLQAPVLSALALNRLFENSAHSSPETPEVSALSAAAAGKIGPFPATEYTNLKSAIKARGVKAALAMQASRTRRDGRYWFTVNILGTGEDFKKIENLFEKNSEGWSYAGIPTDILLRGTPVDPAASSNNIVTTLAPSWIDTAQLKFDALMKSAGGGGIAILRYGWRGQYEMSVFAFPDNPSVSFKEYAANPMGHPKQSLEASLATAAARREAAKILRDAQARNPVSGKDKAALDEILAFLDGD